MLGLSLVFFHWNLPVDLPLAIHLGLAALMATAIALVLLLWKKQQRLFSSIMLVLKRLGVLRTDRVEGRMAKATQIVNNIGTFYRAHKKRFFLVLFFHSMGWMLGACETYVILNSLPNQYHLPRCISESHRLRSPHQQPVLLHAL